MRISIHALREEGDRDQRGRSGIIVISIHALREEGDQPTGIANTPGVEFLSTPSARRATGRLRLYGYGRLISIHALREEGDPWSAQQPGADTAFLSTPSARRAT